MNIDLVKQKAGIVGESDAINQVLEMIAQVSSVDISILINGESGTGKELVSKALHLGSKRSSNELVIVNCGAIPEGIIESELFGHKKGAYTDAGETRKGYFETANKGTIFLDEIGDMPMETQVKVLRVLESGEFMRVGDSETKKTDVRVIAATNKDLGKLVQEGKFRQLIVKKSEHHQEKENEEKNKEKARLKKLDEEANAEFLAELKDLEEKASSKDEKLTTEASVKFSAKSGLSTIYDEPLDPVGSNDPETAALTAKVAEKFHIGTEKGSGSYASVASEAVSWTKFGATPVTLAPPPEAGQEDEDYTSGSSGDGQCNDSLKNRAPKKKRKPGAPTGCNVSKILRNMRLQGAMLHGF